METEQGIYALTEESGKRTWAVVRESVPVYYGIRRLKGIITNLPKEGSLTKQILLDDRKIELRVEKGRLYARSRGYSMDSKITSYFSKELMPGLSLENAMSNAIESIVTRLAYNEMKSRQTEFKAGFGNYIGQRPWLLFKKFEEKKQEEEIVLPEEVLGEVAGGI